MSKAKGLLLLNHFYIFYNGPKHTALVFERNAKNKTYLCIKFGTTKNKDMIEIYPIDGRRTKYVHKRPFEGKRKDYGKHPLSGLSIHPSNKELIEKIKTRKPHKTASVKTIY